MKIGFIGSGKMATALVRGVLRAGAFAKDDLLVCDAAPGVAEKLRTELGAQALEASLLAAAADVLVLCVKPGDAVAALQKLRRHLEKKLVISIVAGLPIAVLQEAAGPAARLVRVMPNTPSLVQKGAAAYALGEGATEDDAQITEKLFQAVGEVVRIRENLLDAVTGVSGSGPAYLYLVIEALADGGVLMGLPRDLALKLAAQTAAGAAEMVLKESRHPAALRDEVTSPGGTTAAALEKLEAGGVRSSVISAVRAATERARELGASQELKGQ